MKGTLRQKTDSSGTAQSDRTRQVGSGPSHGLFLKRMAATLIDLGVLLVLVSVFMLVEAAAWVSILGVHYCRYGILNNGEIVQRFFAGSIASVAWIYYATLESAVRRQSTCGKMIIGLRVTDLNGAPISFLRASGRYWSMYITLLTCGLGYLPVLFTRKKQALHDIISRCLVVGRMR